MRDAALTLIAYRHGLRVTELVSLRWDQVDLHQGLLHVTRRKHGGALPVQSSLRVDLQNRDIERPLLEVCPDGQGRFLNDISFRVLDRLQVRKDFHPRSDPIQGGKLELFVQVLFLFYLYGSDNPKKSVGLVADPGREIKPTIKKVESPKSVEI